MRRDTAKERIERRERVKETAEVKERKERKERRKEKRQAKARATAGKETVATVDIVGNGVTRKLNAINGKDDD